MTTPDPLAGRDVGAVLFDCDGTLVDTMPVHREVWAQILARYDFVITDEWWDEWANVPLLPMVREVIPGASPQFAEELNLEATDMFMDLLHRIEPIEPVIELMEKNASIAACQPKILQYDKRDHFEYAGACGGWIDQLGYPFSRGRVFDDCEKDRGQYDDACPIFWASGAALLIRSTSFWEAGGLDPFFFAHMEEIDLCWRLQEIGRAHV